MKTRPSYLVIDTDRRVIVRTTQRWPTLYPGEIVVRVVIAIPETLIPQIQEFTVDELDAMVSVVPEEVELPA